MNDNGYMETVKIGVGVTKWTRAEFKDAFGNEYDNPDWWVDDSYAVLYMDSDLQAVVNETLDAGYSLDRVTFGLVNNDQYFSFEN